MFIDPEKLMEQHPALRDEELVVTYIVVANENITTVPPQHSNQSPEMVRAYLSFATLYRLSLWLVLQHQLPITCSVET